MRWIVSECNSDALSTWSVATYKTVRQPMVFGLLLGLLKPPSVSRVSRSKTTTSIPWLCSALTSIPEAIPQPIKGHRRLAHGLVLSHSAHSSTFSCSPMNSGEMCRMLPSGDETSTKNHCLCVDIPGGNNFDSRSHAPRLAVCVYREIVLPSYIMYVYIS